MLLRPPPNNVLPIVHGIIELYKTWQQILPHFPSNSRHTLGFRIDTLIIQVAESLFAAGFLTGQRKISTIERSSLKFDSIKFLLKLGWKSEIINNKNFIILLVI